MIFIYFIIFLLIIYFCFLIFKYSGMEKPDFNLEYFRDNRNIPYPPIIVGFLNKKSIKIEHFIATVLDFVTRGYIQMEGPSENLDYIFTIEKNIEGTEFEIKALKLFFNGNLSTGTSQSLNQFRKIIKNEKLFGNFGKIKRTFNNEIRNYFDDEKQVIKITAKKNFRNIILCFILFILTCYISKVSTYNFSRTNIIPIIFTSTIIFSLFIYTLYLIKNTLLGKFNWSISVFVIALLIQTIFLIFSIIGLSNILLICITLIIMGIIILFDDMLQRKKTHIANNYEIIKALKRYIKDYSNIQDYDLYNIHLWDLYFVYAVALNIKKI